MRHTLDSLPATITDETSVTVPNAHSPNVKLLRAADGAGIAVVRPTTADEREWVADEAYAATWLGWHYGQCPAYGPTPRGAVDNLIAGRTG